MKSLLFKRLFKLYLFLLLFVSFGTGCEKDYLVPFPIPGPKIPVETEDLQAVFTDGSIDNVNARFWKEADYLRVEVVDLSTGKLYEEDGLLNQTGTYNGLLSFNEGVTPELLLRAAYDSVYLYILVEWTDSTKDVSRSSWLYNGPEDPFKVDSSSGWTSQWQDDQVALAFEIEPVNGAAGSFSSVGCAAACHDGGMKPNSGSLDIWNWSVAHTEPFGFAFDMHADAQQALENDDDQVTMKRNINEEGNNRSGPKYEWNGIAQETYLVDGTLSLLDPAYFLLEKTEFTGDAEIGDKIYQSADKGCYHCHGENGEGNGEVDNGPAFTNPRMNRFSRESLVLSAGSPEHTGHTYFDKVKPEDQIHLFARLRSFAGIPGYYLERPDSSQIDLLTKSNVRAARIEIENSTYKVLIKRKLNTGKPDDVQFTPQTKDLYEFGIAIMDADGKNHVGSMKENLIFLANED